MTPLDDFRKLFRFHHWANRAFRDAALALPETDTRREIGGPFGSLHSTLVHLQGADWLWLERVHGRAPRALPTEMNGATIAEMEAKWAEIERGQLAHLDSLRDEDLASPLAFTTLAGTAMENSVADVLRHVVNHGTYHRGQLAMMLRMLGAPAPSTDYVRYLAFVPQL